MEARAELIRGMGIKALRARLREQLLQERAEEARMSAEAVERELRGFLDKESLLERVLEEECSLYGDARPPADAHPDEGNQKAAEEEEDREVSEASTAGAIQEEKAAETKGLDLGPERAPTPDDLPDGGPVLSPQESVSEALALAAKAARKEDKAGGEERPTHYAVKAARVRQPDPDDSDDEGVPVVEDDPSAGVTVLEDGDAELEDGRAKLVVWERPLTSNKTTGSTTWESSKILADWLAKHPLEVQGKRVIEVGCGTGLGGLACAALGAHVTFTDVALRRIEKNVADATNLSTVEAAGGSLDGVHAVPWEHCRSPESAAALLGGSDQPFDVIVAADVVFNADLFRPFLNTVTNIIKLNADDRATKFILAYKRRHSIESLFFLVFRDFFTVTEAYSDWDTDVKIFTATYIPEAERMDNAPISPPPQLSAGAAATAAAQQRKSET